MLHLQAIARYENWTGHVRFVINAPNYPRSLFRLSVSFASKQILFEQPLQLLF